MPTKKTRANAENRSEWIVKPTKVAIGDIEVAEMPERLGFVAQLRAATRQVPALKSDALVILEYVRPLILLDRSAGTPQYRLIAGKSTLQVLAEQYPLSRKVFALVLERVSHDDTNRFEAFDCLIEPIISQVAAEDLGVLAAGLLEFKYVRGLASDFIDVASDSKIADAFGISRVTLHRRSKAARERLKQANLAAHAMPQEQISLGFEFTLDEGRSLEK